MDALVVVVVYAPCGDVVDVVYGLQGLDVAIVLHRLMLRFPEGRRSVALVVSSGPCGRLKLYVRPAYTRDAWKYTFAGVLLTSMAIQPVALVV